MTLYHESHVTIEPVFDERLERLKQLCNEHGFRVTDLLMQKRTAALESRMFAFVAALRDEGFKVWRYKIEDVVLDSKVDDSRFRLKLKQIDSNGMGSWSQEQKIPR